MNTAISQELLDRVVDGEASESERARLLAELDRTPESWKRLARAFLEAQCWGEALRDASRDSLPIVPLPRRSLGSSFIQMTILAACIVLGVLAGRFCFPNQEGLGTALVGSQLADSRTLMAIPAVRQIGTFAIPAVNDEDQQVPRWVVTVYEGEGIDPDWAEDLPRVLPEEVVAQLRRQGCELLDRQSILPLMLPDGRKLAVRLNELDLLMMEKRPVL